MKKQFIRNLKGVSCQFLFGYDTYLKMAFGDYMTLPPEEKQIPKHDAVKIDLENSYKIYKGKEYGNKNESARR